MNYQDEKLLFIHSATSSMSQFGVEVAPQIPTDSAFSSQDGSISDVLEI